MKNITCFSRVVAACCFTVAVVGGMVPRAAYSQIPPYPYPMPGYEPAVRITSPANHAVFESPVDIPIFAYTRSEVQFTNVEFYANGVDLGPGVRLSSTNRILPPLGVAPWMPSTIIGQLGSSWCFVWTNAGPPTNYTLTAVAKGLYANVLQPPIFPPRIYELSGTSAPVNITIRAATNSTAPTNIVSILATDPIAIAGTNSYWVWTGMTNSIPSWTNWPPSRWGYFTNWGPKAASFTVRRFGSASSAVTVNYKIGGTASNGLDYVALPGTVTISAGSAYALIPVIPIDQGSNQLAKTVILTLTASSNTPPGYAIGQPSRAEAVIYHSWIRPAPWWVAGGGFHVSASGPDGAWFVLQNSTDLVHWTTICTNQVFQGSIDVIDPNPPGNPSGFYRIQALPGGPSP